VVIEVDSRDAGAAMRAFVAWVGADEDLHVLFTPDVLMAVDRPGRRGYLIDEIYFVTAWIDCGAAELRDCLRRELQGRDRGWTEQPADQAPDPEAILSGARTYGRPIAEVRHLI
jgi:hypothetical protein